MAKDTMEIKVTMVLKVSPDGHLVDIGFAPEEKESATIWLLPVLWDRKKKINVKHYTVKDWATKMHEEISEAQEAGDKAEVYKARLKATTITEADRIVLQSLYEMWDNCENHELMDAIAVPVSRLAIKGIEAGSTAWNELAHDTNCKNTERHATFEHFEHEEGDDGFD